MSRTQYFCHGGGGGGGSGRLWSSDCIGASWMMNGGRARMRSPAAVAVNGPTVAANSDLRHLSEPFGRGAGRTQSVAPARRDVVD